MDRAGAWPDPIATTMNVPKFWVAPILHDPSRRPSPCSSIIGVSAFNGRKIAGTDRWSSHAYGVAIDINPIQNPVIYLDEHQSIIEILGLIKLEPTCIHRQ